MASTVKTLRVPDDLLRAIRERARREHLDESTAMRQLIAMGVLADAVRLYRHGRITLREASELTGETTRDMLEVLLDYGVTGNVTAGQASEGLADLLRLMPVQGRSPKRRRR